MGNGQAVARQHLDSQGVGIMVLLCAIWGFQQVAIKVAAPDIAPIMQMALRYGISAVLVAMVMYRGGVSFSWRDGTWQPGLLAGFLFAAEFLFVAEGLRFTTASHMVVFFYTAPIFTALGLHWTLPAERLRPMQWLGIGIAFGGIALAFAGGSLNAGVTLRMLGGDALGVLAGASWGITTVVIRCSSLSEAPPTKTLMYQLVAAFVLLLAFAAVSGQAGKVAMTGTAWWSMGFQVLVVSFASYLAWFQLLRRYLASRLSVLSFMTPLFGVAFGVVLLNEPIDRFFATGAVLVLIGITLVNGAHFLPRRGPARP